MKRREDWEERLNDYVASVFNAEHEWGTHDCCLFADGAVEAQTGESLMTPYRGKYHDEASAMALVANAGYPNLAALMEDALPAIPRVTARRGDLALLDDGSLSVVWGDVALAVGEDQIAGKIGVIRVERARWRKAWRVG